MLLSLLTWTASAQPWDLVDTFDTLDLDQWQLGFWMLGATQLDPDQVTVQNGRLRIAHNLHRLDGWRGGELGSGVAFTSGRFEARIAVTPVPGTVTGFFLYGTDAEGEVHEVDVEILSVDPGEVWFGTYADWVPADGYDNSPFREAFRWSEPGFDATAWHDYAISWEASRVAFEVDGVEVGAVSVVPTGPSTLRFNHWTSTTWPDVAYPPAGPAVLRVEAVRARHTP